jgi:hypothetical protein
MSAFELELLLAAFAGGAFGAAIGALPAFVFTGFLVIAGEVVSILGKALPGSALGNPDITGAVAFGPAFGPHVAFGGGAAAAAYLARRRELTPEFDYHQAKAITVGLGTRPDVLLVGGVFGVVGQALFATSDAIGVPWDPVAFGVVASALLHRVAFGYSLVGAAPGQWLDMTPFERGERRATTAADGGETATDGGTPTGRYAVEPWLPHQYRWANVAALGAVCGVLGAYIAYRTGSAFLAFGVSAASLLFIVAGVDRIPVTHHMTLPASTVVLAMVPGAAGGVSSATIGAAVPLGHALLAGALLGLIGALVGELCQRVFYAHAETHLDPPAASIVVTSLTLGLLAILDVLPSAVWIPV